MATSKKTSPYGNVKFKTVEEYFDSLTAFQQERLHELRSTIKQVVPQAEEVISYNMPAFKQNSLLVYYAAYAKHIGFYPTPSPIKIFEKELADYKVSKGAIQFPIDKKIPKTLVKKIVKFRLDESVEQQKSKAKK